MTDDQFTEPDKEECTVAVMENCDVRLYMYICTYMYIIYVYNICIYVCI